MKGQSPKSQKIYYKGSGHGASVSAASLSKKGRAQMTTTRHEKEKEVMSSKRSK